MAEVIARCSTGINGLDDVLHGGFPRGHTYLIEGDPGAGKTTVGLQFLLAGLKEGEKALYITLAESRQELSIVAASHGLSIDDIDIFEVSPPELAAGPQEQYTVFHPAEVELADVMQSVMKQIEATNPGRVVIDSMSEFRMLAREPVRYRRQVMSLKQFFTGRNCTALLLDDRVPEMREVQLQTLTNGVIRLENVPREYGIKRRRLEVLKIRASGFREGYHDYVIETGGLRVFPRLVSGEHPPDQSPATEFASGMPELDDLLGGGVSRGTSTLITGPAGCGKSSIATKFVATAADRGETCSIFIFDEVRQSLLSRCDGLGIPLARHIDTGRVHLQQVDPAELSPGEFIHRIRDGVEQQHWRVVVIDSLNGLLNAMAGERSLTVQLHELLSYLNQIGVVTFLVMAQYGILGSEMNSPVDVSYLADNVLLLRYFEAAGRVRQAIAVVKRRSGPHERTIRELVMRRGEFRIGEPLVAFQGLLTGNLEYLGNEKPLL
jgi:circadian clock protein KaiC